MSLPPSADVPVHSSAEVNEAIRRLCAGRVAWSPHALAELARLREQWRHAVDAEARAA